MTTLSTAAWIAHDLGLAAGVGGTLFGRVAMHPATRNITDREQRGLVVKDAWQMFNNIQLGALGLMALTWFAGRTSLSGREVDSTARGLTIAKDVLVVGTVVTAVATAVTGRKMAAQKPDGLPIDDTGQRVADDAPESAQKLDRLTGTLGLANMICGAGVIAVTAVLAMRAGKSTKWGFVSRMLP